MLSLTKKSIQIGLLFNIVATFLDDQDLDRSSLTRFWYVWFRQSLRH